MVKKRERSGEEERGVVKRRDVAVMGWNLYRLFVVRRRQLHLYRAETGAVEVVSPGKKERK